MNLRECHQHKALRLTHVNLPRRNLLRMQELGVRPGTEVVVTQHAGFGGVVLNIGGARVAVDHRSALRIRAEVVS